MITKIVERGCRKRFNLSNEEELNEFFQEKVASISKEMKEIIDMLEWFDSIEEAKKYVKNAKKNYVILQAPDELEKGAFCLIPSGRNSELLMNFACFERINTMWNDSHV